MNGSGKMITPQYLRVFVSVYLKDGTEAAPIADAGYMGADGNVIIRSLWLTGEPIENLTFKFCVLPVMDERLVPMWQRKRDLILNV